MNKGTALIGCGRIGFLLEDDPLRYKPCTHYGGAAAAGIKINFACDINHERLDTFAIKAGIERENLSPDFSEILERKRPALVIISTWTDSHHEICVKASRNGVRVIVLEKPVASNLLQGKKMLEECRRNGVSLIVSHERRYDNRYIKTREMIRNGKIGKIIVVNARMITGPYRGKSLPEEGGGPLLHDGTHLVDIIRYFFGDIKFVSGEFSRESRKKGFEDSAKAWLQTKGGTDVFLTAGGSGNYFQFELDITGTEGRIVIGNGYQHLYRSGKSKFYKGFRDLREIPYPAFKKGNCFINMYRNVSDILRGKKGEISSSGADGYLSLETIHGIYLSSFLGGKRISLPLSPSEADLKTIFKL